MNRDLRELLLWENECKSVFELYKKCFLYPEVETQCNYRKAQYYMKSRNILLKYWWQYKWLRIRKKTKCQVSLKADIGPGMCFLHDGPRIVIFGAKIGRLCKMGINVVVGLNRSAEGAPAEFPIIGDRVYIGHNSTIVGGVKVGNDVVIASNAFVNRDVPDHSIVVGNNEIIHKHNPSLRFINRTDNYAK